MTKELEEKLAKIDICPEPCNDGMVKIKLKSGQTREMPCPIIDLKCEYGRYMKQGLGSYVCTVLSYIGVPRRHLENFVKILRTEAFTGSIEWPASGFLIFTGGTGSGKSFGAAFTLYKYLKSIVPNQFDRKTWEIAGQARNSVMWCAAMDIINDRETAERAKRDRLAVIDDLGGELDTPAGRNILSGVILKRHDMKLPTVITTALTMLDIDIRYGGRIADRLTEDIGNGGMIIECGDVSLRNPAAFSAKWEQ